MTETPAPGFNARQVKQLLAPIHRSRVLRDGKGHSHVSQQDVTAHLIRVFGFGNFDVETVNVECVYETPRDDQQRRWDVCYRALVRLTIRDEHGREVAHYEDGSTATAQNQTRGDAHDLAYKSALSLAKKRAAINLGDQFGLSLYNKGQMEPLVIATLVQPGEDSADSADVQADVPQQVTLGNDETSYEHDEDPSGQKPPTERRGGSRQQGRSQAPAQGEPDQSVVRAHVIAASTAADLGALRKVWDQACETGTAHVAVPDPDVDAPTEECPTITVGDFITRRRQQIEAA